MSDIGNLPRVQRGRKGISPSPKHVVYLAAPITEYGTERYEQLAGALRSRLTGYRILEARGLYASTADWLQRWPDILPTLSHLVFLSTPDGWIGKGAWTEIQDALQRGIPAHYLLNEHQLVPFAKVTCSEPSDDYRFHVQVGIAAEASDAS
jgi:hypothetical protein